MDLLSVNPLKISAPSPPSKSRVLFLDRLEGGRTKQPQDAAVLGSLSWSQGLCARVILLVTFPRKLLLSLQVI